MKKTLYFVSMACFGVLVFLFFANVAPAQTQLVNCSVLTPSTALPTGFASPYNELSSTREELFKTSCTDTAVSLNVGNGSSGQYIYNKGYLYRGGQWQQITYNCPNPVSSAWCPGTATSTHTLAPAELSQTNYVLTYICSNIGGQWKCGCRDSGCSQNMWNLQEFKYIPPTPGGTPTLSNCGNGVLDSGEKCDGTSLGGATCNSVTAGQSPTGTLKCTSTCSFDTSGCSATPVNIPPVGWIDGADQNHVWGWAYDKNAYTKPVKIQIIVDGTVRAEILANTSRPDLVTAKVTPDHYHGFDYSFSATNTTDNTTDPLSAGTHTIAVKAYDYLPEGGVAIWGSPIILQGSPKTVTVSSTTSGGTVCGTANGQSFSTAPSANLCVSNATASLVEDAGLEWTWSCYNPSARSECWAHNTSTTSPGNTYPSGALDGVTTVSGSNTIYHAWGWAYDKETYTDPLAANYRVLPIDIYLTGPKNAAAQTRTLVGSVYANLERADLLNAGVAPSAYHGFDLTFDLRQFQNLTSGTYEVWAYTADYPATVSPTYTLPGSPKTIVIP